MKLTGAAIFLAAGLCGQTPRNVVLTWEDTRNPAGTTYSIWRANCGTTPSAFTLVASSITTKGYTNTAVPAGTYCYGVMAVYGGRQSDLSNIARVSVPGTNVTLAPTTVKTVIE